jgi:hypothetical protein
MPNWISNRATAEEIVKEEEISVPLAEEKKPDEETKPEAQVEEVVEEKAQKEPDVSSVDIYGPSMMIEINT